MRNIQRLVLGLMIATIVLAAIFLAYAIGSLAGAFAYSVGWTVAAIGVGAFAIYGAVVLERFRRSLKQDHRPKQAD